MKLDDPIRAQLALAGEMMAGLSAGQINWRPAEGAWSIGECIAHLNTTNDLYGQAIGKVVLAAQARGMRGDGGGREAKLGWFERTFLSTLEPPPKIRFKAPSRFQPPASSFTREGLLEVWTSTHERLAELARISEGLDVKRVKVASPITPLIRLSLLCALMITPAHNRRHLWQADRVRAMLPGSTRSAG